MKRSNPFEPAAVERFDKKGNAPVQWLLTAHELVGAANLCYRRFSTVQDRRFARKRRRQFYPEFGIGVLLMLYGFALEALLKCLLIARGEPAAKAGFLAESFKTHNLVQLCARAKVQSANGQEARLVEHMTRATQFGRYPIAASAAVKLGLMFTFPDDYERIHGLLGRVHDAILRIEPLAKFEPIDLRRLGVRLIPVVLRRRRMRAVFLAKESGGGNPTR